MNPHHARVALRAGYRCEYCHAPEAAFNFHFEVEHIIPIARQGDTLDENLALACHSCNLFKAACTSGVDPDTNEIVRIFDPRNDDWADHFIVIPSSEKIIGRSAVGRVTVVRLNINSEAQLAARRQWRRLSLFP